MSGLRTIVLGAILVVASLGMNVQAAHLSCSADGNLYIEAQRLMSQKDFNGALKMISLMSDDYAAQRNIVVLKASAFTGLCGVNFLELSHALNDKAPGERILPFLLRQFSHASPARIDACIRAEQIIASIGLPAQRTLEENLLMTSVAFGKVGNILNLYSDQNQNGEADPGINLCERSRVVRPSEPVSGNFNEMDLREVGTGISHMISSLEQINSTVDFGRSVFEHMVAICTSLQVVDPHAFFCNTTATSDLTLRQVDGISSVLKESDLVGLGTSCVGDISVCHCF